MKTTMLRLCVTAAVMFLGVTFVLPGVYSAITGGPVPAPSLMDSWASWITRWAIVSVVATGITEPILRLLTRKRRPR